MPIEKSIVRGQDCMDYDGVVDFMEQATLPEARESSSFDRDYHRLDTRNHIADLLSAGKAFVVTKVLDTGKIMQVQILNASTAEEVEFV